MNKTPELERAKHSLACVERVRKSSVPNDKYLSYAESLPATILMNGLGQAAATLIAAAKNVKSDPHHVLYDHLADWLLRQCEDSQPLPAGK